MMEQPVDLRMMELLNATSDMTDKIAQLISVIEKVIEQVAADHREVMEALRSISKDVGHNP